MQVQQYYQSGGGAVCFAACDFLLNQGFGNRIRREIVLPSEQQAAFNRRGGVFSRQGHGYSGRGGHSFHADEGPRKQPQPHQNRRSVHGGHLSVSRYVQRLQGEISRNRGGNAGVRLLAGCKERGKQHA